MVHRESKEVCQVTFTDFAISLSLAARASRTAAARNSPLARHCRARVAVAAARCNSCTRSSRNDNVDTGVYSASELCTGVPSSSLLQGEKTRIFVSTGAER